MVKRCFYFTANSSACTLAATSSTIIVPDAFPMAIKTLKLTAFAGILISSPAFILATILIRLVNFIISSL